ncbi:MAG: ABC transporter ATP-binding protein, partial [Erysipelotrichales bacterium]|nr:ABC transporter ATP-binding protein [Erysipelotrichales bacterium]
MAYLELRDITFAYDTSENPVFDGFSLSLEKGVCLAVRGDNGAGKTTLFRILNGLSFPVKGEYVLDGVKITREYLKDNANAKRFHKRMGYLFQNPDIMLFNAKVYDEIAFGPRQMGIGEDKVRERTEDCMNLLEIRQLADKAPYHLSEGQKKRVALAAVLALNP